MAAGRDHHQPAPLDDVAGRVLLGMAVAHQLAAPLGVREMVVGRDHRPAGDHLEGVARDIAAGERPGERVRLGAAHRNHLLRHQPGPVGRAPADEFRLGAGAGRRARRHPADGEGVLGADIEREVVAHGAAVLGHEPVHPAIVVAVAMAQDQPVKPGRLDAEQRDVAVEDFGRVAEIQHVLRTRPAGAGFEMQRKPPFAGQGGHRPARDAAHMLDRDVGMLGPRQEPFIVRIDHHPDREMVHHRRLERTLFHRAHHGPPSARGLRRRPGRAPAWRRRRCFP